jgi:uncharacterized protein (DUF433 family)
MKKPRTTAKDRPASSPTVRVHKKERILAIPGVCGGEAGVRGTRVPVWMLVEARDDGCSDEDILENYPTLSKGNLRAAWKYADEHRAEIRAAILRNLDHF